MLDRLNLRKNKLVLLSILLSLLLSFLIGFLIGSSRETNSKEPLNSYYARLIKDDLDNNEIRDFLQNEIKSENIENSLRYLLSFMK
jgi:hypothetical protein